MEELNNLLVNLHLTEDEEAFEDLVAFLEQNNYDLSKSKVSKIIRSGNNDFKCLTCNNYYDSFRELRQHLKHRKHIKSKQDIKDRLVDFLERVNDSHDVASYSKSELKTFISICMEFAYMVNLG